MLAFYSTVAEVVLPVPLALRPANHLLRKQMVTATYKEKYRCEPRLLLIYAALEAGEGIRTLDPLIGKYVRCAICGNPLQSRGSP